jgi:hypothetical protein
LAPNQEELVPANFLCEAYREKLSRAKILKKMVPSVLFWDPIFLPTTRGSNRRFTATEHELNRLFKW